MKPNVTNRGPAFGYKDWYVFNCSECGGDLSVGGKREDKCKCGAVVDWTPYCGKEFMNVNEEKLFTERDMLRAFAHGREFEQLVTTDGSEIDYGNYDEKHWPFWEWLKAHDWSG